MSKLIRLKKVNIIANEDFTFDKNSFVRINEPQFYLDHNENLYVFIDSKEEAELIEKSNDTPRIRRRIPDEREYAERMDNETRSWLKEKQQNFIDAFLKGD